MTLALSFLAVGAVYAVSFGVGWRRAKQKALDPDRIRAPRRLADPITARFQRWHDVEKMQALRDKRWARLWVLITANNLVAVAFVSRTLYGMTLVLPAYFTWRQGVTQGALMAQPRMPAGRSMLSVFVLEFGGYLAATALGINIPIAVIAGRSIGEPLKALLLWYPIVAAVIGAGGWLEVRLLRDRLQGVDIPGAVDMEALRAKAREMLKREWGGERH